MEDENRLCIDKWRGQNLLGKILMRVREDIRHQNKVNQAFQNVEKAFSDSAEVAGFHTESELQDYVTKIRHEKGKNRSWIILNKLICFCDKEAAKLLEEKRKEMINGNTN